MDRGGTFTDVVGLSPDGTFRTLKLLSVSPEYEDAGIEGIRRLAGTGPGDVLPEASISVDQVRHHGGDQRPA